MAVDLEWGVASDICFWVAPIWGCLTVLAFEQRSWTTFVAFAGFVLSAGTWLLAHLRARLLRKDSGDD